MKTCTLCAGTLADSATCCPRCGIACGPFPGRGGRLGRALRASSVAVLGIATLAVLALPLVRTARGATSGCEPRSWTDWNRAIQRACVSASYVCENMTSAKLLQDPALAGELGEALRAGRSYARDHLDALVGHMREVYGCDGVGEPLSPGSVGPSLHLPPGHPPIPSAPMSPTFDAPDTTTI